MLKLLKRKSGFTLVECLISIAVFAIMALLVMTIISASLKAHVADAVYRRDNSDNELFVNEHG